MKFIFVSHGELAESMLGSAQMIVGAQENAVAFGLYPKEDIGALKEKIEQEILKTGGEDVICFTDLFSGSPFNAVVSLMGDYPVHHITGINLPLVLEAFMLRSNKEINRADICRKLLGQAGETIIDVKKYLEKQLEDE